MTTAHPAHSARGNDLCHTVEATASAATELTGLARRWLATTVHVDSERLADIALATYEALANCAEHAYRDHPEAGLMTLRISHDPAVAAVRICITDHGRWVDPTTIANSRGRGIMLMRAVTDDVTIDGRDDGTTVCLHFHRCPRNSSDPRDSVKGTCVCGRQIAPASECAACS